MIYKAVQQTTNDGSKAQQWNIASLVFSGYVGEYKSQNVNTQKLLVWSTKVLPTKQRW